MENIPGFEDRAICPRCNVEESLEHTVTSCQASGQEKIWKLANEHLRTLEGEKLNGAHQA